MQLALVTTLRSYLNAYRAIPWLIGFFILMVLILSLKKMSFYYFSYLMPTSFSKTIINSIMVLVCKFSISEGDVTI